MSSRNLKCEAANKMHVTWRIAEGPIFCDPDSLAYVADIYSKAEVMFYSWDLQGSWN